MNPKQIGRYCLDLRDDNKKRPLLEANDISYANWWTVDPAEYWFTRFVLHSFPDFEEFNIPVRFYSVFGPKRTIREPFGGIKIFFSGENLEEYVKYPSLHVREVSEKVWHVRKKKFDSYGFGFSQISLGFPQEEDLQDIQTKRKELANTGLATRYLRFPLWITYLTEPEDSREDIQKRVDALNHAGDFSKNIPECPHGITCIASHDFYGTRTAVCDALEEAGMLVQYAGKWRHNTDDLKGRFGDDKAAYLRSVRFNVCPENTDSKDYVTEKLFDAFSCGVIPIYHGALNNPEPGVINKEAVLFWEYEKDNHAVISKIRELETDERAYREFLSRPVLTEFAVDYIWDRMCSLKRMLEEYLL